MAELCSLATSLYLTSHQPLLLFSAVKTTHRHRIFLNANNKKVRKIKCTMKSKAFMYILEATEILCI